MKVECGVSAVIFDMDGVLLDTEKVYLESCCAAAEEMGIGDVSDVCVSCIGITAEATKKKFLEVFGGEEECERFWDISRRITRERLSKSIPVKPGGRELLQYLYDNGVPMALASSTKTEIVIRELISVDLFGFFTRIIGGDMVKSSKPDPEIFLTAASALGVTPDECIVIEDSKNGILAASSAGMTAFLVPDLVVPDDEMLKRSARVMDSLFDVISYFTDAQEERP